MYSPKRRSPLASRHRRKSLRRHSTSRSTSRSPSSASQSPRRKSNSPRRKSKSPRRRSNRKSSPRRRRNVYNMRGMGKLLQMYGGALEELEKKQEQIDNELKNVPKQSTGLKAKLSNAHEKAKGWAQAFNSLDWSVEEQRLKDAKKNTSAQMSGILSGVAKVTTKASTFMKRKPASSSAPASVTSSAASDTASIASASSN